MRPLLYSKALAVVLASVIAIASTSLAQESKREPGSVSGRVTVGDKPLAHVAVILITPELMPEMTSERGTAKRNPPARATTDEDGRYRLTGVPAGSYRIAPFTPTFVLPLEATYAQAGKSITLGEGEELEGIDFSLTRGGVVNGRVTDAEGKPLIEQYVTLERIDERGQRLPASSFNSYRFVTDDRAVYRAYGLAAGRYKASVGDSANMRGGGADGYALTFHPDVTDESRATVIEVRAGGESTGVDIRLGRQSKTYVATGRILDADSGKPLPNLRYGALSQDPSRMGGYAPSADRTNENGEFRIDGIGPGRYAAFVVNTEPVDFYTEPAMFEVTDSDVGGLEIKVRRGSSISGIAVVEGSDDPEVVANLSKLDLRAIVQSEAVSAPVTASARISPDGSFRVAGLRPGNARMSLMRLPSTPRGFSLLRVERDGVEQRGGIEIVQGENISGVRLVIAYGTCVVRGQLRFENGQVTPDMRFRVLARRPGSDPPLGAATMADARGRFRLENLIPGAYEITVNQIPPPPGTAAPWPVTETILAKANVTVTNGTEAEITLVINLTSKDRDVEK